MLFAVSHTVPDTFQDRCEGRHSNTRANQQGNLILEHIFRGTSERSIDVHARQDATNSRIKIFIACADFIDSDDRGAFFALFTAILAAVEVASERFGEGFGEVADTSDVDGNIIFFGGTGERERMILP